jgi:uncharacterized membrane protein
METKTPSRWSLSYTGNRVLLAVVLGLAAYVTTGSLFGTVAVALVAFVVATVFFAPRRQAGTDRNR